MGISQNQNLLQSIPERFGWNCFIYSIKTGRNKKRNGMCECDMRKKLSN